MNLDSPVPAGSIMGSSLLVRGLRLLVAGPLVALAIAALPAAAVCPSGTVTLVVGTPTCLTSCDIPLALSPPDAAQALSFAVYPRIWFTGEGYCAAPEPEDVPLIVTGGSAIISNLPVDKVIDFRAELEGCPATTSVRVVTDTLGALTPAAPGPARIAAGSSPAAPPDLAASVTGPGEVTLTFSPPDSLTPGHALVRSTPGGPTVPVASWLAPAYCPAGGPITYVDTGLSNGTYQYQIVTAPNVFSGGGGPSNVEIVEVVAPGAITSFVADPPSIVEGDATTLRWTTVNLVDLWIDGGVGSVAPSGSVNVYPPSSQTYTLTGYDTYGPVMARVRVTVQRLSAAFDPAALRLDQGVTSFVRLVLSQSRPRRTLVTLASSDPSVAAVPDVVSIGPDATELLVPVQGLARGSATIRATLPAELGAGTAVLPVTVTCPLPAAPRLTGPSTPIPAGSAFNVVWTLPAASAPATGYVLQMAADAGFSTLLAEQRTTGLAATLTMPAGARDAAYVRVRGVAECGGEGTVSNVVRVAVGQTGPLVIVSSGQDPVWAVQTGATPPQGTVRFRNVGDTAAHLVLTSSGSFFRTLRAEADVAAGAEVAVGLAAEAGATGRTGLFAGSLTAAWQGGSASAPVSLAVADALADVVPDVDRDTVVHLATGGGVFTEELRVTNPGTVPIGLSASVATGGAWLRVEPLDVASPLAPGATRTVRLRIDRDLRTVADGPPPLFALLDLRAVGAAAGRLVRVFDGEPSIPTVVFTRPLPDPDRPSFLLPAVVHAAGSGGSLFVTDVWIRNLATRPVPVELLAAPRGGGPSLKIELTLPALVLVRLYDLVQVAFGAIDLAATLEIRPVSPDDAAQLLVRAVTEGVPSADGGRTSSEIPVYASGSGARAGGPPLVMTGVEVTADVRTNVILAETSGQPVTVALELVGADGTTLGTTASPLELSPFGMVQGALGSLVGLAPGTEVPGGALWIRALSGPGRVVALGTAIDNVSQSFRALTAAEAPSGAAGVRPTDVQAAAEAPRPLVVPSIVHSVGISAFFTSLLAITNQTAQAAQLELVFDYEGRNGDGEPVSGSRRTELTLPPRVSLDVELGKDVAVSLMGLPPTWQVNGPLRVEGPGLAQVVVRSWVQTPADPAQPGANVRSAEFRAFSATSPEVVGLGAGSTTALSSGVSRVEGQRTNLILAEVAGQAASVKVRLVDGATGGTIGETPALELGPYRKLQINESDLWSMVGLGPGERSGLQLALSAVSGTGRVAGVLTTIESATNATLVTPFATAGPQSPGVSIGR